MYWRVWRVVELFSASLHADLVMSADPKYTQAPRTYVGKIVKIHQKMVPTAGESGNIKVPGSNS